LDEEANLKAIFIRNEGLQNRLKQEAKLKAIPFNENEDVETEKIRKQNFVNKSRIDKEGLRLL
jgi:hypothetical protein